MSSYPNCFECGEQQGCPYVGETNQAVSTLEYTVVVRDIRKGRFQACDVLRDAVTAVDTPASPKHPTIGWGEHRKAVEHIVQTSIATVNQTTEEAKGA